MRKIILILLSLFSMASYAYDACQAYHPYNNPNPSMPCSYNGYDYDSLAVEAGVNSFFYKGQNYTLTDNDWWWSLLSQPYETCDGLMVAWGSYNCSHNLSFSKSGALFFGPGASYVPPQFSIEIEPIGATPGTVTSVPSGPISCGTDPETCSAPMSQMDQASLQATPNAGWAFGRWEEAADSYAFTPNTNEDKTVTARFYRTFRNAVGSFRFDIDDTGGECIVYVRDETDIDYAACHGDAMDCFGLAQAAGYSTGSIPRVGAIAVFSRDAISPVGHVGIVGEVISEASIKLRHSNWCTPATCHTVSEDVINLTTYPVMGYIYPTP